MRILCSLILALSLLSCGGPSAQSDKKPKPTTISKASQTGSLELLMFHIESAHAALNFYILLVTCLTLRLVHTHLHDEGLHELEQLADGDDGTCHRLSSVVNDVDGILNRLLVE